MLVLFFDICYIIGVEHVGRARAARQQKQPRTHQSVRAADYAGELCAALNIFKNFIVFYDQINNGDWFYFIDCLNFASNR